MNELSRRTRHLGTAAASLAALAGAAALVGTVSAGSPGSGPAPARLAVATATSGATSTDRLSAFGHRPFKRTLKELEKALPHADQASIEVKRAGKWVTITFDRGKLVSADTGELTLQLPDGHSLTLTLSSSTVLPGGKTPMALVTGKPTIVISRSGIATRIVQPDAEHAPASTKATTTPPVIPGSTDGGAGPAPAIARSAPGSLD